MALIDARALGFYGDFGEDDDDLRQTFAMASVEIKTSVAYDAVDK